MKKLAFLIAANCLFMAVSAQTTLTLATGVQSPGTSDCTPSRTFVETSDGYRVTYRFDKANVNPDDFYPNTFELSFNTFGMTHETSKPALPIRVEDYFLTEGKTLQVSVVSSQYTDLNMPLAPAKPLLLGESDNLSVSDVPQISSYSGFYPSQIVKTVGSEFYRNAELAYVNIFPVQYDMQNNKVRAYSEITFDVKFVTSPNRMTGIGGDDNGYLSFDLRMPKFDDMGGGEDATLIYSTKPASNKYVKYDYLVISAPQFENAVEKFCKWKRQLGYNMYVEYRSDWTTSSIKEYIYNFASTHPDFSHLLMFGSFFIVPGYSYSDYPRFRDEPPYDYFYSDLQYACLNGTADWYPDVIYGRLPVSTLEEATVVVDKIVKFESLPPKYDNFYKTATFAAIFQTPKDENPKYQDVTSESHRQYTETCEIIRKRLAKLNYNTNYFYQTNQNNNPLYWSSGEQIEEALRKPNYQWNSTATDINSAINSGTLSVLFRGHGCRYGWFASSGLLYQDWDIATLSNDSLQPLVLSIACSTGRPGYDDSFAEAFLKKLGGGCSGIIAPTDVSVTDHNNCFADGMFNAIWTGGLNWPTYEIGKIMQYGHTIANRYFDGNEICKRYQKKVYHCYGDPSMRIYTRQPMEVPEITIEREPT